MTRFFYKILPVILFYILGDWYLTYIGLTYYGCYEINPIGRILFLSPIVPLVLKSSFVPILWVVNKSFPRKLADLLIYGIGAFGFAICCFNTRSLLMSGFTLW